MRLLYLTIVIAVGVSSCSTFRRPASSAASGGGLLATKAEGGLLGTEPRIVSPSKEFASTEEVGEIAGIRLEHNNFDLPVTYNKEVEHWVKYFSGPARKHFAIYLERMARVEPLIRPRLKAAGIPEDLIYLALIESGFSTAAKSWAGAVGPWQFIRSTGRLYGLQNNWWVDERRDPVKSTDAAVEFLSRLHAEFGDWYLACAAYNSGELKIRRAISKLGTRDFWKIAANRRALRRETKDYVPKMLAAAIIGKNYKQFGFVKPEVDPSFYDYDEIKIPKAENIRTIARAASIESERLRELNPHLLRCCTPPIKGEYTLRVPKGESYQLLSSAIERGEIGKFSDFTHHVVKRGDSLARISSRYGVPIDAILATNEIRVKYLKPGTELVIPEGGKAERRRSASIIATAEASTVKGKGKAVTHVVRKGDTLYGISRRYAVQIDQIRRWNALGRAKNLRPGSRIKLYVRNENSQNI